MDRIAWPRYANNNKVYREGKSMEIESRFVVAWGWGWAQRWTIIGMRNVIVGWKYSGIWQLLSNCVRSQN